MNFLKMKMYYLEMITIYYDNYLLGRQRIWVRRYRWWGRKYYKQVRRTMSRNCFIEILRFIYFDKKVSVANAWKQINSPWYLRYGIISLRIVKSVTNQGQVTVDEQLSPTKARCRCIQYMPNRQDKFGIKFWLAALPYLGKDEDRLPSVPLARTCCTETHGTIYGLWKNCNYRQLFYQVYL